MAATATPHHDERFASLMVRVHAQARHVYSALAHDRLSTTIQPLADNVPTAYVPDAQVGDRIDALLVRVAAAARTARLPPDPEQSTAALSHSANVSTLLAEVLQAVRNEPPLLLRFLPLLSECATADALAALVVRSVAETCLNEIELVLDQHNDGGSNEGDDSSQRILAVHGRVLQVVAKHSHVLHAAVQGVVRRLSVPTGGRVEMATEFAVAVAARSLEGASVAATAVSCVVGRHLGVLGVDQVHPASLWKARALLRLAVASLSAVRRAGNAACCRAVHSGLIRDQFGETLSALASTLEAPSAFLLTTALQRLSDDCIAAVAAAELT
jgi:hypothetical protein